MSISDRSDRLRALRRVVLRAGMLAALACAPLACAGTQPALGEVAHPTTRDGWALTVEHLPPAPGVARKRRPVVLCHGVLANRAFFLQDGEASLARVLTREGYDVWLMDMRGRPGGHAGDHGSAYSIDDVARDDVDTVLTYVLSQTKAHDVTWIGHSMGGMVAYARLGVLGDARIGRLVTVGSPGLFAPMSRNLIRAYKLSPALSVFPSLPVRSLAAIEGGLGVSVAPRSLADTIYAEGNMTPDEYHRLQRTGVSDASAPELRQFLLSLLRSEFVSADGALSYTDHLRDIHVPTLVIVGRADELADPIVGRGVYERLGSEDKELVVAGRAEGFSTDFGHVDLLLGAAARREIYPRIVAWVSQRDGE